MATHQGWLALPFPTIESETYIALMGTVAQASAAVLALFFAAISIVASTSYAKATTDIRALVAEDDLNRRYLKVLAHTATVAVFGVVLQALGVPPSTGLAAYVIVIACVCLLAFLPLGVRTFTLFDPSNLTHIPERKFVRAVRSVTQNGRRWLDPSFQRHANDIAERQLQLLADLMHFAITDHRPRQKAVLAIAASVNRLARFYATSKSSIPSDSEWFTRKAEFRLWELADCSTTELTLETGVAPRPEGVPDHGFVEHRCTDMTMQCLQHLSANDAIDEAVQLLLDANSTATAYARFFGQDEAIRVVAGTRRILIGHFKPTDPQREPLKHIGLVDVQCVAALAPILTAALSLSDGPVEALVCHEAGLLRLSSRQIHSRMHPRCVLQGMEDLLQRLKFEKSVEGIIRTRGWYVRQTIALGYAEAIRKVIRGIVATIEQEFVDPASELVLAKQVSPAGVWLHRGIEACQKATHRIEALQARYTELKHFRVTEVPWLPSGAEEALPKVETARAKIVHLLAEVVPDLCQMPSGGELPDLVGQTRARVAEELISLMERKHEDGFGRLFLAYFNASTAIVHHFLQVAQQPGKGDHIRVAMDAMLDLMDLSGHALLYSELDDTRLGAVVTRTWDIYFDGVSDKPDMVRSWYNAVGSRFTLPVFSPSAMQRQTWGRRFAHAMADRGIDVDRRYGLPWGSESVASHPSAVIDSINVHLGHSMREAYGYFGALYLAKREDAQGIEIPAEIQRCIDAIERATERQKDAR